jgi:release factor glutamine methyltransferase
LAEPALPAPEARALLAWVLRAPRERLVAHPEAVVTSQVLADYTALVARRQAGEPLAYLLGEKEFYGRPFRVTPDVLVPRPDTETLIDVALACVRDRAAPRILDLGTGSGCVAITLQLERPDASVWATDVSAAALAVARANAQTLGAGVTFLQGDWFAALGPGATFDLIVSNPPYVAYADPHLAALRHEPPLALTDGGDGLQCLSILIGGAQTYLRGEGCLALEHGYDQAAAVAQRMRDGGFRDVTVQRDAGGQTRVTAGRA